MAQRDKDMAHDPPNHFVKDKVPLILKKEGSGLIDMNNESFDLVGCRYTPFGHQFLLL
jgi:hypothetical protein